MSQDKGPYFLQLFLSLLATCHVDGVCAQMKSGFNLLNQHVIHKKSGRGTA